MRNEILFVCVCVTSVRGEPETSSLEHEQEADVSPFTYTDEFRLFVLATDANKTRIRCLVATDGNRRFEEYIYIYLDCIVQIFEAYEMK